MSFALMVKETIWHRSDLAPNDSHSAPGQQAHSAVFENTDSDSDSEYLGLPR